MSTKEFDNFWNICPPVLRPSLEVCENRGNAGLVEERDRILKVLVEIGVEDTLIHKVQPRSDVEQNPAEIMELKRREDSGVSLHCRFYVLAVIAHRLLAAGLDLCDDREAVVGGSSRKDWSVASF